MKRNILYFTRTMGLGGTEKVILQMCENLSSQFNKIILCSSGGVHEDKLKEIGVKHYKIGDIEDKSLKNVYLTIKTLNKIIKEENIEIIHTHHRMAAFYIKIFTYIKKFKFVHTSHNTFFDKKILTKWALKNSNIIAVGQRVKKNLSENYNIKNKQINVIYNGVEQDNSVVRDIDILKKYKQNGYFLIGNIGRLSKQKGMEYYISAIPKVLEVTDKIIFFIIGDGEDKNKLEKLAVKLNIKENIIFMGYRNDINNIIKQLDLIVLSSLWEGLPLTPLEAFSNSKTIIATDVDGTCEIVEHMINGILVRSKDSNAISQSILKLWNNKQLRLKLEYNALKTYKQKFTIEVMREEYINFYNNI